MKKTGTNCLSTSWNMVNYQVSQGIKQKSNEVLHVFSIITWLCTGALSSLFGCDAWMMKKENKWCKKPMLIYWGASIGATVTWSCQKNRLLLAHMVRDCMDFIKRCDACQLHAYSPTFGATLPNRSILAFRGMWVGCCGTVHFEVFH